MNSIKKAFPHESALKERLDVVWGDLTSTLHEETYGERREIEKYRNPFFISAGITGFFLLILSLTDSGGIMNFLVMGTALIFAGYYGYRWHEAREAYTKKLNAHTYRLVFRFFEIEGDYYGDDGEVIEANADAQVAKQLVESELITEDRDTTNVGDVFRVSYEGSELLVGELDITRTEGSGKRRRTVPVFKGLFAEYTLGKMLTGTTFVSAEGDTKGYGHRDFWGRVTGKSKVEETELEWNEFEKDLHVATTDGSEARYILTPDLMQDLHDWWKLSKPNIRLVFKRNKVFMLFPDKEVKVNFTTSDTNTYELKAYAMTIIVPLWHVLRLLEDVNERFPN